MSEEARRTSLSAVFFDFDGTLVDTESTVLASWEAEYSHHGQVLDRSAWLSGVGTEGHDWYADLEKLVGPSFDRATAQARRRASEADLVADLALREGLVECLDEAHERGLVLAVVSSSPRDWVLSHLGRLDLLARFDAVITREDAARAKPYPDLYIEALRRLDLSAEDVLVVEDSLNGVAAAVAAGLTVIAIPNPVTSAQTFTAAAAVVDPLLLRGLIRSLR